jgi:hypothetical protein
MYYSIQSLLFRCSSPERTGDSMPRAKPQVEVVKLNGNELLLKLKPAHALSKHKCSLLHTYTKYKNVTKVGDSIYRASTTLNGHKIYLGTHATEVAAAIAVAEADKDIADGETVFATVHSKPKVASPVMSPLHGINDQEASRLASPVSFPPSPLEPVNIIGIANGNARLHKSLLESWQEDHGTPFKPTANASTMRIPHI